MRRALPLVLAAAALLPGCGSGGDDGKPIPLNQAQQMLALLGQADSQESRGICNGADAKVRQAQDVLDGLPRAVDKDVRQGLADGFDRLRSLIASECKRPTRTDTQTTETETLTTQSETTPTTESQTTPTETTPTATETTPTATDTGTTPTDTGGNGGTPPPPGNGAANGDAP